MSYILERCESTFALVSTKLKVKIVTGHIPFLFLSAAVIGLATLGNNAFSEEEVLCGPDIITIGDAWERVELQNAEAHRLLAAKDLARLPQKVAAIHVHLRFLQRGAIMVFGKRRSQLDHAMSVTDKLRAQITAAAIENNTTQVAAHWAELDSSLRFIATLLPDEALIPSTTFAHLLPPSPPLLHIQLEPVVGTTPGKPMTVTFQLIQLANMEPVTPTDLFVTHGAVLHALICDRALSDYHHQHPTPTGQPGQWQFTFTPQVNDSYTLWINSVPRRSGREEFALNLISSPDLQVERRPVSLQPTSTVVTPQIRGELHWMDDVRPKLNKSTNGTLRLLDSSGDPITDLQSYMGAFAHIVGIAEDMNSILHVHPEGAATSDTDHGGPEVRFSLRPTRQGFYRLFVQVMRHDEVLTLPFGLRVD